MVQLGILGKWKRREKAKSQPSINPPHSSLHHQIIPHSPFQSVVTMATPDDDLKTLTEETLVHEKDAHVENPNSNVDGSNGVEGTLAEADELFQRGSKAIEEGDYNEAADCLSRALEIK